MNRVSRRSAQEAAEALLEVGRKEPVLRYDVELGLARHHDRLRSDAPLPEWASEGIGAATAAKSSAGILVKTIVSAVLVGTLGFAAWQARELLQPSAAAPRPVTTAQPEPVRVPNAQEMPDPAEVATAPMPIPVSEQALPRAAALEPTSKRSGPRRARKDGRGALVAKRATGAPADVEAASRDAPSRTQRHARDEEPSANSDLSGARAATVAAEQAAAANREEHAESAETKPRPKPKAQAPDDLIEMQQVARAEQLLQHSPARALALVREGEERFAQGYFQQERAYIAIMALIRLGRIDEARARAAGFAQRFPALPYGARVRSALEAASSGASGNKAP